MEKPEDDLVEKSRESIGDRTLVFAVPADALAANQASEIDVSTLINIVWAKKVFIVVIVAAFTLASLAIAVFSPEWYVSDTLLAPAESQSDRAVGTGGLGSLGGLAGLAGLTLEDGQSAEAIAILESRDFTRSFIEQNDLMQVLFADEWDADADKWKGENPTKWPDIRDGVQLFGEEIRTVSQNSENGLVTLSIAWTDPQLAANWVSGIVNLLNEQMRQRALAQAEFNIAFLDEQLSQTSVAMLRQSLANILEGELERLMLAKGGKEYAFRVLDAPQVSKRPDRPKRALIVIVGTVLGGVFAIFYILLGFALKRVSAQDLPADT